MVNAYPTVSPRRLHISEIENKCCAIRAIHKTNYLKKQQLFPAFNNIDAFPTRSKNDFEPAPEAMKRSHLRMEKDNQSYNVVKIVCLLYNK